MSYTYTQDVTPRDTQTDFVPSYARRSVKAKKVKTWMVLAPIAGVVMLGGAAIMLMNAGGEAQPLAEPAPVPSASAPALLSSTPAPVVPVATAPEAAPAPVMQAPARVAPAQARPTPVVRRTTPAARPAVAEAEITGPEPYQAPTAAAQTTPRVAPAPMAPSVNPAPAPSISVSPLN